MSNTVKVYSVPITSLIAAPNITLDMLLKEKYIKGYLSKDVEDKDLSELIDYTINLILLTLLIIHPIVNNNTKKNFIISPFLNRDNKRTHLL